MVSVITICNLIKRDTHDIFEYSCKRCSTGRRFWALKFAIFSLNENVQNIENNEKSPKYYTFVQTE